MAENNDISAAVDEATRLSEIGFPEFTTKLITDVFDALVSANLRQTESYVSLLQAVGKSLKDFVNDTKDDIDGAQILQFLAAVAPGPSEEEPTKVAVGKTLSSDEADRINKALALSGDAGVDGDNKVVPTTQIDQAAYDKILEAVARRIAANKYDLLKEMVKQGMLRLVVEEGLIETHLTFHTYASSFYNKRKADYHRDAFKFRAKVRTGSLLSPWVKASASASYSNVNIRTTNETQQDRSGSSVNIFGLVRIKFKTDYLPLNNG